MEGVLEYIFMLVGPWDSYKGGRSRGAKDKARQGMHALNGASFFVHRNQAIVENLQRNI
jgi:hypothetical protein